MGVETKPWIGVDLDGTLATHTAGDGIAGIGAPVELMVTRVKAWLAAGWTVKIVTARVGDYNTESERQQNYLVGIQRELIKQWCKEHLGQELPITNAKDFSMIELWDDRAVCVRRNKGDALAWDSQTEILK